jgi:threonine/homoserine/homoserine lactone efflux protein
MTASWVALPQLYRMARLRRRGRTGYVRRVDASFLGFLGLSAAVIATPGPDTALTVRNTLAGGRRGGTFTALGVSVGQVIWSVATSLGLVALLLASEPVFRGLRLLGAAYLVHLGVQSLRAALRGDRRGRAAAGHDGGRALRGAAAFRQGIVNNLANPKMAVFFASALPQFAPAGAGMLSALLGLGLVFCALTFLWLALYALVVARAGRLVLDSRLGRALDGAAGLVLIGLGVRIAAKRR